MSGALSSKLPIFIGLGSTAALSLIKPATGAVAGTFFVAGIITDAAINACVASRINAHGVYIKIAARLAAAAVSFFVAWGAGIGTAASCLVGSRRFRLNVWGVDILTESNIGVVISSVAMIILTSLAFARN